MNIESQPLGLRWLFLDMNSFFASCEQQENPRWRGRPVAVVPMEAETTCAIAASYEAKRFGIKTGTLIKDARVMCPDLVLAPARPKLYVEYHHRFVEAIEECIPVEDVLSVDEVACRLDKTETNPDAARRLALRIKTIMRQQVGECMTCSIGIASNKLLGKLASDMQKPDGLTILRPEDMPHTILHLQPSDICGIGRNMSVRLEQAGLRTMADLWYADAATLRRVWGGVMGARFHALLHGQDLPSPSRPHRSLGHQHVLPPDLRTIEKATPVIRQLLSRAALRLREGHFYCKRLILDIKWMGHLGSHVEEARFTETQDTQALARTLAALWARAPRLKPLRVGVTLADLVADNRHQFDLFERRHAASLTQAVDVLNKKFGKGTVAFGPQGEPQTAKIAFSRVPDRSEV